MATFTVSSLRTTQQTLSAGDEYFLLEGVTHYADIDTVLAFGSGVNVFVFGTLFATSGNAVDSSAINTSLTIGPTGSVTTLSSFVTIDIDGARSGIVNAGFVSGAQVNMSGLNATINNSGTMAGSYVAGTGVGWIRFENADAKVTNTGVISATSGSVIQLANADVLNTFVDNQGMISGSKDALMVNTNGAQVGYTVQNSGTISALGFAIQGGEGADRITNSGLISGEVDLQGSDDVLVNSGEIAGEVGLGDGADLYKAVNAGFATSLLDGGAGNDTLMGATASDELLGGVDDDLMFGGGGNDTLFGDSGLDTVVGGDGQDLIRGGNDVDVVRGGQGDDTVYGDGGADQVYGGSGADELFGGSEDDRMFGGDGNDVLEGDGGADRLLGGNGNDTLVGGAGRDNISGDLGEDTFKFTAVSDSAFGSGQEDRIFDFSVGEDVIDLSEIIGPELGFVGAGGLTPNSVRTITSGANTLVDVDVTGDGAADMRIFVLGVTGLTQDDFVL